MQNMSGIQPIEYNVLLKQDKVDGKTKGGIHLPDDVTDREKHGQTHGVLVAISDLAFNEDIWPEGRDKPQPGQRVAIAKHAGTFVTGNDGEEYRLVKDKDVVALIEAD